LETIDAVALMLGAGWAAGLNLYAAILVLGWLGMSGQVTLPPDLQVLSHPGVLAAAAGMYALEFFADKIPGVDSAWDLLHTFVRIPGGALLAAGAAQGLDAGPAAEMIGMLVGGGLAAGSHVAKAGSRAVINTSPEPFSNWTASVGEDVAVVAGLWTALSHPWLFVMLLGLFLLMLVWLLPRLWRILRGAASALMGTRRRPPVPVPVPESSDSQRRKLLHDIGRAASDQSPGKENR
jgi:hypothetical protein